MMSRDTRNKPGNETNGNKTVATTAPKWECIQQSHLHAKNRDTNYD